MNVPFPSMTVTYRQQYPGGYPMFVVRFTGPRPPNGERVATTRELEECRSDVPASEE